MVSAFSSRQQARACVELGYRSLGCSEDVAECVMGPSRGCGYEEAVAIQGCRVQANWSASPPFPVKDHESRLHQVGPVQVAVHCFPLDSAEVGFRAEPADPVN